MNDVLKSIFRKYGAHMPGLMGAKGSYAVLCPFYEGPEGLALLFEVRAAGLRQGGEVCFPGGRMEVGESPEDCALRETEEELSIPGQEVNLIGRSDFICSQRGFLLQPMLGVVSPRGMAALHPSPSEVADTFTAPLSFFLETPPEIYRYRLTPQPPENFPYRAVGVSRDYPWAGGAVEVPVWYWEGHAVWGMTARIVRDILKDL